ncbi:hypothetical protein L3Y34_018507 [Caenorhabditis briggsae]|uniref:Uncharacterized protein n=1 Tax=Caenorhabditis briggsae TaxID=6238 RepID=A0AAE9IUW7_CAEBR|nr:hypothetical protein L3Y34_018507 [Caenorhabditis briggsae]
MSSKHQILDMSGYNRSKKSATSQEWLVANDIVNLSYPHRRNDDGRYAEILAERVGDEDSSGSGDDEVGED